MPAKAPNLALAAELGRLLEYSLLRCMHNVTAELRDSESVNLKPLVSRHIPRVRPPSTVTQVPVM